MIEIVNIIFLISSMTCITCFPILRLTSNNLYLKNNNKFLENSLNLSIFLNIFLILSFFETNLSLIFYLILILPIIMNIFFVRKFRLPLEFLYLFIFTLVISINISSNLILEWDAAAIWIYRVKNFFFNNNFYNLSNIPGVISYPHLGTYIWSFFWKNNFFDAEYTGRIFYAFCYSLSILTIINFNQKELLKKIIITSIFYTISIDYYLFSGYQEYLVFSCLIFIFYFYKKYYNEQNVYFLIPIILFINSIIWIKNEAAFFILFFFIFVFFKNLIEKKNIKKELILIFLIFLMFVLIKYLIFYESFNVLNSGWHGYTINKIDNLIQLDYFFERLTSITLAIFIGLIKCKIYIVFFLTILFLHSKKDNNYLMPFLFFLILNVVFIFFIYYFTNDPAWRHYMSTTVDRILFQTSGVFLIPILYYLKKIPKIKS